MTPEEIMMPTDTVFTLTDANETLVTIKPDGTLEYGPNYTPDAAAKAMWSAISKEAQLMLSLARREAYKDAKKIAEKTIGACGTPNDCLVCNTRKDIAAAIHARMEGK
jgi:hypothetical protein